jgi:hypothetical protein
MERDRVEKGQAPLDKARGRQDAAWVLAAVDSVTVRRQGPAQGQAEGVADAATVRAAAAKAAVAAGAPDPAGAADQNEETKKGGQYAKRRRNGSHGYGAKNG